MMCELYGCARYYFSSPLCFAWRVLGRPNSMGYAYHRLARDILASPKLPDSRCIYCAVDAIVAVRNESANVFGCVNTLLSQKGVRKVIIVDDHSDDGTAELARSLAEPLRPVTVLSLEGGELGKADACWAGARLSDAEWLLFVDADTRLQEGVVEKALSLALQRGVDAVSILGSFRCSSILGEAFTALNVGLLNAFATLKDVNDTAKRTAYFAGSFILSRRSQYLALGGHSAVRCEIVEDKALAELYKKRGYRILLCYAPPSGFHCLGWRQRGWPSCIDDQRDHTVDDLRWEPQVGGFLCGYECTSFGPLLRVNPWLYGSKTTWQLVFCLRRNYTTHGDALRSALSTYNRREHEGSTRLLCSPPTADSLLLDWSVQSLEGKTCKVEGSTISTTKGSIHSCIRQYKRKLTLGSSATTLIA